MAEQPKNIVVIGASWAGLNATHSFLRQVLPQLKSRGEKYKLVLISPSTHLFWRVGAPRSIVDVSLLGKDKMFEPIEPRLKQYGSDVAFQQGTVTAVDAKARTVTYTPGNDSTGSASVAYHALIIASGISTPSPLTTVYSTHTETMEALAAINKQLKSAKEVVIGGGGPVGVETAGEIGAALNGWAGWFAARPATSHAKITVITGSDKLLPVLRKGIATKAETFLNKVGVDVRYNTRVESTTPPSSAGGRTTVALSDGTTIAADVYIPAGGATPNTSFLPAEMLDDKGYVRTVEQTARLDPAAGAAAGLVYVVGDVASSTNGGLIIIDAHIAAAISSLAHDLGLKSFAAATFSRDTSESQIVPIGDRKGVGAFKGFKFPSFAVAFVKGKDYFIGNRVALLDGSNFKIAR